MKSKYGLLLVVMVWGLSHVLAGTAFPHANSSAPRCAIAEADPSHTAIPVDKVIAHAADMFLQRLSNPIGFDFFKRPTLRGIMTENFYWSWTHSETTESLQRRVADPRIRDGQFKPLNSIVCQNYLPVDYPPPNKLQNKFC